VQFEGRVALVTGAARNIGRATALAFAQEGADVVVTALTGAADADRVADEIRALGRRALVCTVDTTDEAGVQRMQEGVLNEFGRLDVLVLNAAIRPGGKILEMSYADWRRVIDTGLDSAFHCTRAFLPGMLERSWGRIITFGGAHALQQGSGAAKGGLLGFTRCLAVEVGGTGVTVNMVSPGSIATIHEGRDLSRPLTERIPAGRRGYPEEIAAACVYLASEGAAYVTGQVLSVNGGLVMG
jgi:3-oxoacyl-[acyl-carrier protein] reductase